MEDLNEIFSFERKQFLFTGLYPLPPGKHSLFYTLKTILVFTFSMILPVSMIIKLLIGVESLEELSDILYYLSTQTAYICKLLNFVYGPGKLLHIEEHLRHPIVYKYYNKYGWEELQWVVKLCDFVAKLFRFLIVMILALYALLPYLDANRVLPFSGWFPVDIQTYKWYIYTFQLMCLYISAATNGNMDIFTIYLISIGIGKLKLIKECFSHVDYSLRLDETTRKAICNKYEANDGKETISPNDLTELYLFHEYIITYISMVESLFSYGIFIQFLASIGVICMSGFQMMITPPLSGQFVLLIFYSSCMMCQVIMYCWYGNEILTESEGLGESFYMSNWYEGTAADKKFMSIFMERSKRQIRLTAGKFFTLSLPTLVMILKSSYSYFAVLKRLYSDK